MPRPPKLDPVRGHQGRGPVALPAAGRAGDPPAWPLGDPQSPDEADAWAQLWATPQAAQWERLGWTRTVARYCRVMVAAEEPGAKAALLAQATVLEDRLGLTPKAMRLLLWQVVEEEPVRPAPRVASARTRLRAVAPAKD
jgi:hypothetical protein